MKKLVSTILLLTILFILNIKSSTAETANISDTKIQLIQNCEEIYPDLEKIGVEKFRERYQYFENFRSCAVLFNNPLWYSNSTDRIERLASLLDKPTPITSTRDRPIQLQVIPEWIKADAKRWQQGMETDNVLSYGIRYLINSNMIQTQIYRSNSNGCETSDCSAQNNFVKYSVKNSNIQDVTTITNTFHSVNENSLIVTTDQISKSGKITKSIQVNKDILTNLADQKCCDYHSLVQTVLPSGMKVNANSIIQQTNEIIYPFKDQKRSALVAKDRTASYYEIIDKQTGIIIFAKHQDRIKKTVSTVELVDTNMFGNDIRTQYDTRIPSWFKNVVQWWIEGNVTDEEYLSGIAYLISLNVLRI